jgi:class 3 adenylate cyclase
MTSLAQVFQDQQSRVVKVIVAVDLTNSTSMKAQQAEASWLNTYAWFYDQLRTTINKVNGGKIVKYLGDGGMAVFSEDNAADAINWAIIIQETFADAQAANTIDRSFHCSIGIACGGVIEFDVYLDTTEVTKDYIGTVVDKAFRLCSAANAKAIFVDTDTSDAAAMNRVVSRLGANTSPKRKVPDYLGREESISALKGFSHPVNYHEIFWGEARYGVSPPFISKLSTEQIEETQPSLPPPPKPPTTTQGWMLGYVHNKNDTFGFIRAGQEDFYFNATSLFRRDLPVEWNAPVWFIPADPLPNAKSRRALDVVGIGAVLDGKIEKVSPQGFGFALCPNSSGHLKQLFIYFGDVSGWSPGMEIEFTIGENKKGPVGLDPKPKNR